MVFDYYNLGRKVKKSIRHLAQLDKQHDKLIVMQITYNVKYKIVALISEREKNW